MPEYSQVRAFLNSLNGSSYDVEDYTKHGFIDKAFSPKARVLIKNTIYVAVTLIGIVPAIVINKIDK